MPKRHFGHAHAAYAPQVVGPKPLEVISRWMNKATGHFVPVWNPYMPKGAAPLAPAATLPTPATTEVCLRMKSVCGRLRVRLHAFGPYLRPAHGWNAYMRQPTYQQAARAIPRRVVYMPACVTRMMGPSASDYESASVHEKLMSLFSKAG